MTEKAHESLDIDVLFVGAGPAGLAGAYHLAKLVEGHNESLQSPDNHLEPSIAVLEKGKELDVIDLTYNIRKVADESTLNMIQISQHGVQYMNKE